jgi:hypothetical protein
LSEPVFNEEGITLCRNGWQLDILPQAGELHSPEISDHFSVDLNEGEPEAYHVAMPQQYHIRWKTPVRQTHDLRAAFKITRSSNQKG